MIKIKIDRHYESKQTKGDFLMTTDTAKYQCKTLELAWLDNKTQVSCIPEGIYKVVVRYSNKYSRHLHITDVNGRTFILIHWGNYAGSINKKTGKSDILGCILVGVSHIDIDGDGIQDITSSKTTFDKIMKLIKDEDSIELEICGNGGQYGPK